MKITEDQLEIASLEILEDLGYRILFGPDISPDGNSPMRSANDEVFLNIHLSRKLTFLNPNIPRNALEDAFRKIHLIESPDIIFNNRSFHKMLIEGIPVNYQYEGRLKGDIVQVIDFEHPENNDWLAINQYTVIENRNRRPDIILFCNGIPLVVIELKNPADEETTIRQAYNQLQTYKNDIPSLFRSNELLVISDGYESKIGSLSAGWEWFMPWRTIEGEVEANSDLLSFEVLFRGILDQTYLLDYIKNFITFEDDNGKITKKSAGYHQFHAVNHAVNETIRATDLTGDKKVGVVWHTQGSGKSLTMLFYSGKIVQLLNNPTLLVLTDRNDLDNQLFGTFALSKDLLRQIPKQAETRDEIKELLKTTAGGVIFSTIQKFFPKEEEKYPLLSDRRNIIVIADEAHRSHYSFKKRLSKEGKLLEGFAIHIRNALPKASFIGFTATPIELVDKNTIHVFGNYISVYDISQSVKDKTTIPIYYESRLAKIKLNEPIMPYIDEEFNGITEDEEEEDKEKLKSRWSRIAELVGDPDRLREVGEDILNHFDNRIDAFDGKAMIVCMTRKICADLYQIITEIKPEWHSEDDSKGEIKVIISGSASDEKNLQPHIRPKNGRSFIKKRLIDSKDPLKILIVCDMWLTGFNAPCLHTMYIDKPIKGHNLMQAIARVNRVYRDKPGGLIVDYIGIGYYLKQALKRYSKSSRNQTGIEVEEAIKVMKTYYEVVKDLFFGFDYSSFFSGSPLQRLRILAPAIEHILGQVDGKKRFLDGLASLNKAYALAVPHEDALAIRDDLAFFQAVRAGIIKATVPENQKKKSKEEIEYAIKQLVSKAVVSDEVIDIFKLAGLPKPEISILSEEFLKEVKELQQKNFAVEMLQKLLNDEIKARTRKNLVQSKKFSEMLKESIIKYQNRTIEATAILEELLQLANDIQEAQDRGEDLELREDEIAFFDALTTNQSAVEILGDDTLKEIAKELVHVVRRSATIDFTVRTNVQAKMRVMVRRLLRKYNYPPDLQPQAVKLVMEQAMLFGEDWALLAA